MTPPLRTLTLLLALAPLCRASDIAVDRGQTRIGDRALPLVCLEIATVGAAVPVDSIVLQKVETGEQRKIVLADSLGTRRQRMLTAFTASKESLSLPIFHLEPGRYMIKSIDLVGGGQWNGFTTLTIAVNGPFPIWFAVTPGCINFVGGISIWADWAHAGARIPPGSTGGYVAFKFASSVTLANHVGRDAKWACDEIPGIARLPAVVHPLEND